MAANFFLSTFLQLFSLIWRFSSPFLVPTFIISQHSFYKFALFTFFHLFLWKGWEKRQKSIFHCSWCSICAYLPSSVWSTMTTSNKSPVVVYSLIFNLTAYKSMRSVPGCFLIEIAESDRFSTAQHTFKCSRHPSSSHPSPIKQPVAKNWSALELWSPLSSELEVKCGLPWMADMLWQR